MHTSAIRMHIFGSCSLSPSAYKQRCVTGWDNEWHTSASNHSALVSVAIRPSLPRRLSHSSHTGHNGNDCKLLSSSEFREEGAALAEEEEITVGVNVMPVDGFDMSSVCTLPWTLMSRLQLESLMRSSALASRQLEMLTRMVRWAGHWRGRR